MSWEHNESVYVSLECDNHPTNCSTNSVFAEFLGIAHLIKVCATCKETQSDANHLRDSGRVASPRRVFNMGLKKPTKI